MGRGLGITKRRGVSPYVSKGRLYYRFRMKGKPQVNLPGPLYSPEFEEAYRRALEGEVSPGEFRTVEGSLGALCIAFYSSPEWSGMAASSQTTYRRFIEFLRQDYADLSVGALKTSHIVKLRDKVATREVSGAERAIDDKIVMSGPTMANRLISVLRLMLEFAVTRGWRSDNPARNIKPINVKSDGFPTWSEGEILAFEAYWPVGTRERLAFDLLLYTAQRSGDVRTMTWKDIKGDAIAVRQEKTKTELVLPIHPRLRAFSECCDC